jgi:hypothetical protein
MVRANPIAMRQITTSRTLVKSPPELWAECSDAASLARHLDGSFGEIRITGLQPETEIAWEGETASGTIRIEPSAWGTRVTLTARVQSEVIPEPLTVAAGATRGGVEAGDPTVAAASQASWIPAPIPPQPAAPPRRRGVVAWLRARLRPPAIPLQAVQGPQVPQARAEAAPAPAAPAPAAPAPAAPTPAAPPPPAPAPPAPAPALPAPALGAGEPKPESQPPPVEAPTDAAAVLAAALESLGRAHHRPFSRA